MIPLDNVVVVGKCEWCKEDVTTGQSHVGISPAGTKEIFHYHDRCYWDKEEAEARDEWANGKAAERAKKLGL